MSIPILLYIDDRPQVRELCKTSIESLGYSVLIAASASKATETLENTSVAAVLVEYQLESMEAGAVAFDIKKRFPDRPVILLSACSETPEQILWLVDEFVWKGEPLERIADCLERATRSSQKDHVAA